MAHASFSPPGSDTTEEELGEIGPFAEASAEAFEILLPLLAVACLWLFLLRSIYDSGVIWARPQLTQIMRRLCLLEYLIVGCSCKNRGTCFVMSL